MAKTLTLDIHKIIEDKLGREEGKKLAEALEATYESIDEHIERETLYRKIELRDELLKELASKAELQVLNANLHAVEARLEGKIGGTRQEIHSVRQEIQTVRQEIQTVRQEIQTVRQEMQTMKVELDRKFTTMFIVLLFAIVFLNQNALEFIFKVVGLIR